MKLKSLSPRNLRLEQKGLKKNEVYYIIVAPFWAIINRASICLTAYIYYLTFSRRWFTTNTSIL